MVLDKIGKGAWVLKHDLRYFCNPLDHRSHFSMMTTSTTWRRPKTQIMRSNFNDGENCTGPWHTYGAHMKLINAKKKKESSYHMRDSCISFSYVEPK